MCVLCGNDLGDHGHLFNRRPICCGCNTTLLIRGRRTMFSYLPQAIPLAPPRTSMITRMEDQLAAFATAA